MQAGAATLGQIASAENIISGILFLAALGMNDQNIGALELAFVLVPKSIRNRTRNLADNSDGGQLILRCRRRNRRWRFRFTRDCMRIDPRNLHSSHPLMGNSDLLSRAFRKVEAPAVNKWASIVDAHLHRAACVRVGHLDSRAHR